MKKDTHCCLEQRGEGDTHPELPGKGEGEAEGWGKREFPGSIHEGLLVITAVHVDPPKGSSGTLEARGDLHSWAMETMKEA
jgi:hypothetical protein